MSGETLSRSMLPGGIALSRLRVYSSRGPDGQCGGTPHVHLASDELYYAISGTGAVEFLVPGEGFLRIPLEVGSAVQHGPGIVHRLINEGDLEVLVVMQNAGLPELGDTVFTFSPGVLHDQARYDALARANDLRQAESRRDAAVDGFLELAGAFGTPEEGDRRLAQFQQVAARFTAGSLDEWAARIEEGPLAANSATKHRLDSLRRGDLGFIEGARVESFPAASSELDYEAGICGLRWPIPPRGGAGAAEAAPPRASRTET